MKLHHIETYFNEKKEFGPRGESLYAVFVPLINKDDAPHLLFQVRSANLRHQPGEVAFPGGRVEPGESFQEAALRETCEELGTEPEDLQIYGPLEIQFNALSRMIFPFVGTIKNYEEDKLNLNPCEVEKVVTIPLEFFRNTEPQIHHMYYRGGMEEGFPVERIRNHESYQDRTLMVPVYFYEYEGLNIWGLTAKITRNLVLELEEREGKPDSLRCMGEGI